MRGTTVVRGTPFPRPRDGELPVHPLVVPRPHSMPFAVGTFDALGPLSRSPLPHRHTFHEIVHVTAGTGVHVVDLARWELAPPHLCVLTPGQVHHWEDARGLEGTIVLFTDDFLIDHPEDRDRLRALSGRPWLTLDPGQDRRVARLIGDLRDEYAAGTPDAESVLRALLHVLIARLSRLPASRDDAPPARMGGVTEVFTRLVARPGHDAWTVKSFADLVGVTPDHLTEAVRGATGRTASEWVREARVREAKRLLVRTSLTVRQVGSRLGFTDPAYFCRFFRRETGSSPGRFRAGQG